MQSRVIKVQNIGIQVKQASLVVVFPSFGRNLQVPRAFHHLLDSLPLCIDDTPLVQPIHDAIAVRQVVWRLRATSVSDRNVNASLARPVPQIFYLLVEGFEQSILELLQEDLAVNMASHNVQKDLPPNV